MPESFKKVIFLTDRFVGRKVVRLCREENALVIALCVGAKLTMEKEGILCSYPDDLIDLPDLNSFGIENIERARRICASLDSKLREKIPFLDANGIDLLTFAFFAVKNYFDVLFVATIVMERLFEKIRGADVILAQKNYALDGPIESLIIRGLLENVFLKDEGSLRVMANGSFDLKEFCLSLFGRLERKWGLSIENSRYKKGTCGGVILQGGHDVSCLASGRLDYVGFYKLDVSEVPWLKAAAGNFEDRINEAFAEICSDADYRRLYPGDTDLFNFANDLLKEWLLKSAVPWVSCGNYLKEKIATLNPKFAITATCRFGFSEALIYGIVKSMGIPLITYQEGGGVGYTNWPFFNLDMELSDYFLVYGEGVGKSECLQNGKAEVVSVGSIRLEEVKKTLSGRKPAVLTLMIVPDHMKTDICMQHYPYNGGFFSQAYRHQLKILGAIRNIAGIRIIIKAVRGKEYLYERYVGLLEIETRPFADVLDDASAFVIDYPSTVLQECLLTGKPVALLYNKGAVEFEPQASVALGRRVRMSAEPDEFADVIGRLIEDAKHGTAMTDEKDFLEQYCFMEDAGGNFRRFFNRAIVGKNV